jgi:hypothetical protein
MMHRLVFAAAVSAVAVLTFCARAPAHDAPSGWTYPFACCASLDCRQAAAGEVLERPEGYVVAGTGEVIPMTDARVRPSPDGLFHRCAHRSGLDAGKTICLFVPPRSF